MTQRRYPEGPGFQHRDTSEDAATEIEERAVTLRAEALMLLRRASAEGLTADEVATQADVTVLAMRPRITELSRLGLVVDSGKRRKNVSGKRAIVWRVESVKRLRPL
jgi:hypothetical protein